MNALWSYFWPALGEGIIVGIVTGLLAFRRHRKAFLLIGCAASLILAALWHGPLGAANRFTAEVEREVRATLIYYRIPQVSGHLHRKPLTRRIFLSGPADDFQRSELLGIVAELPGVESVTWSQHGAGVPLIIEGAGAGLLGFLLGLIIAYVLELRRRYNMQWDW